MSIHDDIAEHIGSIAVGASAWYPVESEREECTVETIGEQTGSASMLRRVWTVRAWAVAATAADKATLQATLTSSLVKRGSSVFLSLFGEDKAMLAAAAAKGYPRVRVSLVPDDSVGPIQFFDVVAETLEPINNGSHLAEHTQTTEVRVSQGGAETRVMRGAALLTPAASATAREWVVANVLPGAQAAATTLGLGVVQRYTVGDDAKRCEYEITLEKIAPQSAGGSSSITEAEVNDQTEVNDEGREQRTVSGYAEGEGASAFAVAQAPAGSGEVVVRSQVSEPRSPDGRVTFSFVALKGVSSETFPGAPLLSVEESIEDVSEEAPVQESRFLNSPPLLFYGMRAAYRYRQSTTVESLGELAGPPSLLLSADYLARKATLRKSRRGPVVRTTLTADYVSATPLELPSPRSLS